jgi:hypothetical protein
MDFEYRMATQNYNVTTLHSTHYWCAEIGCWQIAIHVGFGGSLSHEPQHWGNCQKAPYTVLFAHGCIDDFGNLIITKGWH